MHPGFLVLGGDHEVEFRLFGARRPGLPPLVTFARAGTCGAALMGRLYYRDELRAALAGPSGEAPVPPGDCPDADLVLAAYRRWGQAGLARLEGDFALVLWDGRARRLVACRDPMGGYPLFWTRHGGRVAFSTSIRALVPLLPARTLDLEFVADYLMQPGCYQGEVLTARCVYEGIQRVRPTIQVSAHFPGGKLRQQTTWDWLERLEDPATDRLAEVSEQYVDRLRQAVRQRLRGRTASHLSGGLDSTTVTLLASECVRAGQAEGPVHTFSLVYRRLPVLARETPFIEEVLRNHPELEPHFLPADDLAAYAEPVFHEEPWPGIFWAEAERREAEVIAGTGAATLLTGFGAEETLGGEPVHIADLLRRGRLLAAWREAARWARAANCSLWGVLYPYGLAHLLPAWARDGLGPVLRGGYARWAEQTPYTIGPWVLRDFAQRYRLRDRAVAHLRRGAAGGSVRLGAALAALDWNSGDFSRWYSSAPSGVVRTSPFLDARVVRLGLGIQRRLGPIPGLRKPVLAEALRGVVPEAVRARRQVESFNEYCFGALAASVPRLEALVRRAPIDGLGLFDRDLLLAGLHQAALGVARDIRTLDRLHLTLSLLQWLAHQEDWQRAQGPPTAVIRVPGQDGQAGEANGACVSGPGHLSGSTP
jgi:asparagine synthase (glutamine-hydrolysing)